MPDRQARLEGGSVVIRREEPDIGREWRDDYGEQSRHDFKRTVRRWQGDEARGW